jgi:hypothetical protein
MADPAPRERGRLIWRISPVQTALLILVACPCAAVNLYAHPTTLVRVVTIAIGVTALAYAYASRRMYLVVDDDGVGLRYLRNARWLPWSDIDRVEIVSGVRGSDTIRPTARRMLKDTLRQIEGRQSGRA